MAAPLSAFRTGTTALVRAVARPALPCLPVPDLDDRSPGGSAACIGWLRAVWANGDVAEALQHASPVLAMQVRAVCTSEKPSARDVRRTALSVARYLLRSQHRATPFGLFAGVTTAEFGARASAAWGAEHVAVGRAGAEWLAAVVERLESFPDLLERLPVVVNNTVTIRGDRLIVPFQSDVQDDRTRAVEASLALTEPVRAVLAAARAPIRTGALEDKLRAEFPAAGQEQVHRLLGELIRRRVLITSLYAPSTETDALGYLLDQLDAVDAGTLAPVADAVCELRAVRAGLEECGTQAGRDGIAARMRALVPDLRRHPIALDLRLDAQIVLPEVVAREVERAALILTRMSPRPYGTAAWGAYHQRFYERYSGRKTEPGMTVFDIRLGLTILDAIGCAEMTDTHRIVEDLHRRTTDAQDGYAARENLAHPLFTVIATDRQAQDCRALVRACALGAGTLPHELQGELASALRASDSVIRASLGQPFDASVPMRRACRAR